MLKNNNILIIECSQINSGLSPTGALRDASGEPLITPVKAGTVNLYRNHKTVRSCLIIVVRMLYCRKRTFYTATYHETERSLILGSTEKERLLQEAYCRVYELNDRLHS